MRRADIEADVISPHYYHIMSCPEWEDAEFEGNYGDPVRPDWTKVDTKGFRRPNWFVQGPRPVAYSYFKSIRQGRMFRALSYKLVLDTAALGINTALCNFSTGKYGKIHFYRMFLLPLSVWAFLQVAFLKFNNILSRQFEIIFPSWRNSKFNEALDSMLSSINKIIKGKVYREILNRGEVIRLTCKIKSTSMNSHVSSATEFYNMAKHYDIIIAYATEGIYPLLAGMKIRHEQITVTFPGRLYYN